MKVGQSEIRFHYLVPRFFFPRRSELKRFLFLQLRKEGKKVAAINYIFCEDDYLLQINKEYLNHDTLTDIITFELSPASQPLISDIYISIDRVRENAKLFQSSFSKELLRVVFHGALHLAGYKDKRQDEAKVIREKENHFLHLFSRGTYIKPKD